MEIIKNKNKNKNPGLDFLCFIAVAQPDIVKLDIVQAYTSKCFLYKQVLAK